MSLDGYPLHRLNSAHVRAWLTIPVFRKELSSWLAKNYKTGTVLLSPTLRAFATVSPTGDIVYLAPPHKKYKFWQIANKPSARYAECACRNFYDPESGGRWGDRDKEREADLHHPHCQGRRVAVSAWNRDYANASVRVSEKRPPQARPDEWIRTAKELEGK